MRKKKLLMLNYEFPPLGGGAGNANYYILKEFSKPEHQDLEIEVISSSIDDFEIRKFSKNITLHLLDISKKGNCHYQSYKDLLVYSYKAYKYAQYLEKERSFDSCHVFFGVPCGFIAMILKKKFDLDYIVSLRGSDVTFYNKRFFLLDKIFLNSLSKSIWRQASAVIANSQQLKELAQKTDCEKKIEIIYNGIDAKEFVPIMKKEPKKEQLKIISTGRLISRKGYNFLIPALNGLNVSLEIIGIGPLRKNLEILAQKNDVMTNFRGVVEHSQVKKYLQRADVFILPSLNEGMSNAVLEAMACGLPIIVTDTGGASELIKGNGFIIQKGSYEAIRDAVKKYIEKPKLINTHAAKSRELAEKMSWQSVAEAYRKIYERKK